MTGATATELELLRVAEWLLHAVAFVVPTYYLLRRMFKKQWPFNEG
jgi:flagellar biogenesis protein FliO